MTKNPVTTSGTVITPELAKLLADEAETGYDLNRGTIIGRGRPSLSGTHFSPQVTFRLSTELRTEATERAAREGRTLSELARTALEEYLTNHHSA